MNSTDRRGEIVTLLGGLFSLAAAVVLCLLALASGATSFWAGGFQVFGAVGIWLVSLIHLHQQRLVAEERMEVSELERQRRDMLAGARPLFEEQDIDQMESLAMGRRLRSVEKYLIPIIALLFAAYNILAGLLVLPGVLSFPPIDDQIGKQIDLKNVLLFFAGGIAFLCFMLSRYALGMSRIREWAVLRAGGNFMFGTSIVCLAMAIGMLCSITGLPWVEYGLTQAIGYLLLLLGAETIFFYIFDFYRPRRPGDVLRPFYDSRIFGMFSEPGGILRSMASAVDYQFGFKVSETWFYRLLGRIVVPLLLVQIVILFALTCIVVVPPGHQAVIEHFGRPVEHTAKPGIHLTWFWPVDRAIIIPVENIQRMEIGFEREDDPKKHAVSEGPILWTKRHYKKEYQLVVADRAAGDSSKVPINLLSMNMPVQWRVRGADDQVLRYYAQAEDVPRILAALASRELTRYAASADVLDLLGGGGIRAAEEIQRRLQSAVDSAGYDGKGLGVDIVFVGIGGVHPPPDDDVAKAYEEVVGAYERKDARIKEAEGDAARIRVDSAGIDWRQIFDAIVAEDSAIHHRGADRAGLTARVDELLRGASGGIARAIVAAAEKRTLIRVFEVKASAERYAAQLEAYSAAPGYYALLSYLRLMEEGLQGVQKFVILLRDNAKVIYDIDLKPPQTIDILGAEVSASESKQ